MCRLMLAQAKGINMTKDTQILIGVAALLGIGIYFYTQQKSTLSQYQNAYNVLAEQLGSGKLIANPAQQ